MTLEFEKLTADLEKMAQTTARRLSQRRERVAEALDTLHSYRTNWTAVSEATKKSIRDDGTFYWSAKPLNEAIPLDSAIPAPFPPRQATLIAVDGSQIMPDRHSAHLYCLINIGGIVYHHGTSRIPEPFSKPEIMYPETDEEAASFIGDSTKYSIQRDLKEIRTLAEKSVAYRNEPRPLISILDQRLLYWPSRTSERSSKVVSVWMNHMTAMRHAGALLCGYLDKPETSGVVTLLRALFNLNNNKYDWALLGSPEDRKGLTDRVLFSRILMNPGERSPIFAHVTPPNEAFIDNDRQNEVCFFYLNPGPSSKDDSGDSIVRVDLPRWVADDEQSVAHLHGLVMDQCEILGGYPYVITRADEMAVVGKTDTRELNFMIDIVKNRHGISDTTTSKQKGKDSARGKRTRHDGF